MQIAGVESVGSQTKLDGISRRSSDATDSNKKQKKIKSKFVRLLDEMHMQKEQDTRIKQAFTFGLKLNKNRLPDRLKLFESLNKIVKNHDQLGLTRAEGNKIRNSAISSELTFEKYYPERNVS